MRPLLLWAATWAVRSSSPKEHPSSLEGGGPSIIGNSGPAGFVRGPAVILHPSARYQLLHLASEDRGGVKGGDCPVQTPQTGSVLGVECSRVELASALRAVSNGHPCQLKFTRGAIIKDPSTPGGQQGFPGFFSNLSR